MSIKSPINGTRAIELRTNFEARKANPIPCEVCKKRVGTGLLSTWHIQIFIWGVPFGEFFVCHDCFGSFEFEVYVADLTSRIVDKASSEAYQGRKHLEERHEEWTNTQKIANILRGGEENVVHWF